MRPARAPLKWDSDLYGKLIRLALPIVAANLLQTMYNLADTFFLGKLGKEAVSAPSIALNIFSFLIVFGFGFASAGTTLIAQSIGKRDREKADFYLGQMTTLMTVTSLVIAAAGILLSPLLIRILLVPEEARLYTWQYMTIIFAGLPFMFMAFILQGSLQGIGDSLTPLLVQGCAVILNIVLDPLLVFGAGPIPAMEVKGAAFATVFAQFTASIASLLILVKGKRGIRLSRRNLRPRPEAYRLLLSIGLPSSIGQGVSALGFTVLQGIVNGFGTAVVAAFGIGNRIIGLFNLPAQGLASANAVLVGQKLGAKEPEKAKTVVMMSMVTITVFISLGMVYTFFRGSGLVRFFVNDPEVIGHGARLFRLFSPSVVFFAIFTVITGAFQGGGDTKPVMILSIARLWLLRVPLAVLLSRTAGMGAEGIWAAMFISNTVIAAAGFLFLSTGRWLRRLDPDTI